MCTNVGNDIVHYRIGVFHVICTAAGKKLLIDSIRVKLSSIAGQETVIVVNVDSFIAAQSVQLDRTICSSSIKFASKI